MPGAPKFSSRCPSWIWGIFLGGCMSWEGREVVGGSRGEHGCLMGHTYHVISDWLLELLVRKQIQSGIYHTFWYKFLIRCRFWHLPGSWNPGLGGGGSLGVHRLGGGGVTSAFVEPKAYLPTLKCRAHFNLSAGWFVCFGIFDGRLVILPHCWGHILAMKCMLVHFLATDIDLSMTNDINIINCGQEVHYHKLSHCCHNWTQSLQQMLAGKILKNHLLVIQLHEMEGKVRFKLIWKYSSWGSEIMRHDIWMSGTGDFVCMPIFCNRCIRKFENTKCRNLGMTSIPSFNLLKYPSKNAGYFVVVF